MGVPQRRRGRDASALILLDRRLLRTFAGARHRPCRHGGADVKRSARLPLIEEHKALC
jgi:hypothetical protein